MSGNSIKFNWTTYQSLDSSVPTAIKVSDNILADFFFPFGYAFLTLDVKHTLGTRLFHPLVAAYLSTSVDCGNVSNVQFLVRGEFPAYVFRRE